MKHVRQNLSLVNCDNKPIYGEAELGYILLSSDLSQFNVIEHCAPLDISKTDHVSLLTMPVHSVNDLTFSCIFLTC